MLKATKKSISLSQSKCPLSKTIDCIIQSLGAVEVDGSYSMPPQLLRTGCFQGRMRQSLTLTQIAWISLSRVLILLKCHHFRISRFNREICLEYSLMPRSFHLLH